MTKRTGAGIATASAVACLLTASCGGDEAAPRDAPSGPSSSSGATGAPGAASSSSGTSGTVPPPRPADADPCRSIVGLREGDASPVYRPESRGGDVLWVDTPEITHTRDFFSYADFVTKEAPLSWNAPIDFTEGQIWLRVHVISTPPGAKFPFVYSVTWNHGEESGALGFLRAAVEIDKPGPAVYEVVADVRSIEYSPDGGCCQSICDKPWPWSAAARDVAGDVILLSGGEGFPLVVKTRIVLRPPPRS